MEIISVFIVISIIAIFFYVISNSTSSDSPNQTTTLKKKSKKKKKKNFIYDEYLNDNEYLNDYDGGHNNYNYTNLIHDNNKNSNFDNTFTQTQNESIMYDIRNLTISSTNPCLLVYLIDQSSSMRSQFGNASHSIAFEVSEAINDIIYEVGLRCIGSAGEIKNRFEIAIIGYGKNQETSQSAWEGQLSGKWVVSIKNIFDYPIGHENDKPIWIKPYSGYDTPMTKAFENAKRLCNDWINWGNHKDCHPPIIINITDGEATDGGHRYSDLIDEAQQIQELRTHYGTVKIMNIHISSRTGDRILFPNEAPTFDKYCQLLFDISSPLDENMIRIAQQKGYNIKQNAKGYVFNGNASDLINFLNIGTPQ